MAGLSVHTKLVLGPRRARPSLAARPVLSAPPSPVSGGMGGSGRWRGGPGEGGALCWASPPSWQPCRRAGGLFCNTLEATANRARLYVAEKVPGPGCPAGFRRGRTPPGSQCRPSALLGGGLLVPRPDRPKPSRIHRGTSSDPAPGGHGSGVEDPPGRAPREKLRGS